mmetsp:Transcript_13603/g.32384  ORF Transcript_13603/g.32384 Transcript_13603/m.32384 type:complete len:289 (+) Transcript_13603:678-1544(+)
MTFVCDRCVLTVKIGTRDSSRDPRISARTASCCLLAAVNCSIAFSEALGAPSSASSSSWSASSSSSSTSSPAARRCSRSRSFSARMASFSCLFLSFSLSASRSICSRLRHRSMAVASSISRMTTQSGRRPARAMIAATLLLVTFSSSISSLSVLTRPANTFPSMMSAPVCAWSVFRMADRCSESTTSGSSSGSPSSSPSPSASPSSAMMRFPSSSTIGSWFLRRSFSLATPAKCSASRRAYSCVYVCSMPICGIFSLSASDSATEGSMQPEGPTNISLGGGTSASVWM